MPARLKLNPGWYIECTCRWRFFRRITPEKVPLNEIIDRKNAMRNGCKRYHNAVLLNSEYKEERAVFHRPHPQPNTDKGAVNSVKKFLQNSGVKP
jgi:hypothetical protein